MCTFDQNLSLSCCSIMSHDEIRVLIRTENGALLDATLQKLKGVIVTRLAGQEARLIKEISAAETYSTA